MQVTFKKVEILTKLSIVENMVKKMYFIYFSALLQQFKNGRFFRSAFFSWEQYQYFLKWFEIAHIIKNIGNPIDISQLITRYELKIIPVYIKKDKGDGSAYSWINGDMFQNSSPRNFKSSSRYCQSNSSFLVSFRMSKTKVKLLIYLFWNLKFIRIKNFIANLLT